MKPRRFQPPFQHGVVFEQTPDQAGASIFRCQQHHTEVNADHICVVPVLVYVEGIGEPVPAPKLTAVPTPQVRQGGPRLVRDKEDTGQHRRGRDRAVVAPRRVRPVADRRRLVVCADAPEPLGIGVGAVRVARAVGQVRPMRVGPSHPPVPSLPVALPAHIAVARRHLRHEQRVRSAKNLIAFQTPGFDLPGVPGRGRKRVCLHAQGQPVQKRRLAVALPARFDPAAFRLPAHRKRAVGKRAVRAALLPAVPHPAPVRPLGQVLGQPLHLGPPPVVPRRPRPQQQQGGVNGRQFAAPDTRPGLLVHKMEKEAMRAVHAVAQKAQRRPRPRVSPIPRHPAMRDADRQRGQRIAGRRHRSDRIGVRQAGPVFCPVFGQSGFGIALIPEELEGPALRFFQGRSRGIRRRGGGWKGTPEAGGKKQHHGQARPRSICHPFSDLDAFQPARLCAVRRAS